MKKQLNFSAAVVITLVCGAASAWSNHGLSTYLALKDEDRVSKEPSIESESLIQFLEATKLKLPDLLGPLLQSAQNDHGAKLAANPSLNFDANLSGEALKLSFLRTLRLSTRAKYRNFLQDIPGADVSRSKKISITDVSLVATVDLANHHFLDLRNNEKVSPLMALSSYVDEPDFGMDVGLFADSPNSPDGQTYGMGNLPFGNKDLEYGSQAPLHMAFHFEGVVINGLRPSLLQTYTLMRINQFSALAKFAFAEGRSYWGYRFAAWALHYVQDLTQPYHSTLAPGHSATSLVTGGLLDIIGNGSKANALLNELTSLHTAVEDYQFNLLTRVLRKNLNDHPLALALRRQRSESAKGIAVTEVKLGVAKPSNQQAKPTAASIKLLIPQVVFERGIDVGVNYTQLIASNSSVQRAPLDELLVNLMHQLGSSSRRFLTDVIP